MPIMALFRSSRVDRAAYDAIITELNLESDPPKGSLAHAAGFDGGNTYVVDVWETRQDFDAFVAKRLGPTFAKLKLDVEPPMVLETYAFEVTEGVDRYKQALAHA